MWELPSGSAVFRLPRLEAALQLQDTWKNRLTTQPLLNGAVSELEKDAFPFVLNCRYPGEVPRQFRPPDSHIEFALGIRSRSLKSREAHQGHDFPEARYQDHFLNPGHPWPVPFRLRKRPSIENALGAILPDFVRRGEQSFQFRAFHGFLLSGERAAPCLNFCPYLSIGNGFQRVPYFCLPALTGDVLFVFRRLQEIPGRSHRFPDRLISLGKRDHADPLRKVGIRRGPHQQPVHLLALFFHRRTEPRPCTIASTKHLGLLDGDLCHAAFLTALAANPDLRK